MNFRALLLCGFAISFLVTKIKNVLNILNFRAKSTFDYYFELYRAFYNIFLC